MANTANNQSGNPSRQLTSSLDVQQEKLDAISTLAKDQILVLKDILDVVKNIADNMAAGLRAQNIIYAVQPDANRLAEAEKEREANRQNVPGKNDPFKSLKGVFDGLNKGFNFIKIVLIPMLLGFLIGFRKKFDLYTIAIGFVILKSNVALTLLFKAFKGIISFAKNLIPTIKDARVALGGAFRTLADAFNRSNITRIARQVISGIQGFFSNLISRIGNVTGITKKLETFSKFLSNVKTMLNSTNPKRVFDAKAALGKFGENLQTIYNAFQRLNKSGLNPNTTSKTVNGIIRAVVATKNFFLGVSSLFSRAMAAIKPGIDFLKSLFKPLASLLSGGTSIFQSLTPLFKVLKFTFNRIITPILAIIGGIKGAIEGFEKEGVIGAIKGAIAGALDMAFDWIFDLIGWVFGKLGFEDAEKALEKYGLGETISFLLDSVQEFFVKLLEPIFDVFTGKIHFLRGLGRGIGILYDTAKDILEAIIGTLSSLFGSDTLYDIAETLREFSFTDLFEQIWEALKEWILGAPKRLLGIGNDEEPNQNKTVEKLAKQAEERGDTDLAEELRAAKSEEEAKKILMDSGMSEVEANVAINPEKYAKMAGPSPAPADTSKQVGDQQKLDAATEEKQKLAAAPPKPQPASSAVNIGVNAPTSAPTIFNREMRGAKDRGAPGNLPGRRNGPH